MDCIAIALPLLCFGIELASHYYGIDLASTRMKVCSSANLGNLKTFEGPVSPVENWSVKLMSRLKAISEKIDALLVHPLIRCMMPTLTLIVFLLSISTTSPQARAANNCEIIFHHSSADSVPIVVPAKISEQEFRETTEGLRSTLTGKLATVWRSEWKTKLQVQSSNAYVQNLIKAFLTPETQAIILKNLDPLKEEFVRSIHERMYRLQQEGRLDASDEIFVRDAPAPPGAIDRTFTYYTKPIISSSSEGKHQIRVRTYLREVQLAHIPISSDMSRFVINGFDMSGRSVTISRAGTDSFSHTLVTGDVRTTMTMSSHQLYEKYGPTIYLFAPHGKNFKLEVKTALTDEISGIKYPLLGGKHMVQKLDMTLSLPEVVQLFAPVGTGMEGKTNEDARREVSLQRLQSLSDNSENQPQEARARITAVLRVLADGIKANPDFLTIEGATLYHRTAFESKSGFQSTIDREQGVFAQHMYEANQLKSPGATMLMNLRLHTGVEDARHVELKVPVTIVGPMLGIEFNGLPAALPASTYEQQVLNQQAIGVYYPFVENAAHSGKFNYMLSIHALDDH